jgi:hypothetical protein
VNAQADPDRPSLGVVVAGGLGVLAIVAFVAVLLFGAESERRPGDRVEVVRTEDGVLVLAGRCAEQRVTEVGVLGGDGRELWRIRSAKGSIERRYPLGSVPDGFSTVTPLAADVEGRVVVEVGFDREGEASTDVRVVDLGALPDALPRLDDAAPPCGSRRLRPGALTALLFLGGAAAVVVGYIGMVVRYAKR